jgi:hypothetical protein
MFFSFSLQHFVSILHSPLSSILSSNFAALCSYTLPSLYNLAFLCPLLSPLSNIFLAFSTSSCSFHPEISAPYINILSIMFSNIIILLLKSPPHFLSPIPQTHPTTLSAFLTISQIYALSVALSLNV